MTIKEIAQRRGVKTIEEGGRASKRKRAILPMFVNEGRGVLVIVLGFIPTSSVNGVEGQFLYLFFFAEGGGLLPESIT